MYNANDKKKKSPKIFEMWQTKYYYKISELYTICLLFIKYIKDISNIHRLKYHTFEVLCAIVTIPSEHFSKETVDIIQ